MKVGKNAVTELIDTLILWEATIVAILPTYRTIKRFSECQQNNMIRPRGATFAVTSLFRAKQKILKSLSTTTSRGSLSAPFTQGVN